MIVGFGGRIGAGKSEAANALFADGYRLINFADELKAEVTTRLRRTCLEIARLHYADFVLKGQSEANIISMLVTDKPGAFRWLLQEYGTEVRRADSPDYWINHWSSRVTLIPQERRNVVCADVRFANEINCIKFWNGLCIRILRPNWSDVYKHESEQLADDSYSWDITLLNDGTIPQLHDRVRVAVDTWAHKRKR